VIVRLNSRLQYGKFPVIIRANESGRPVFYEGLGQARQHVIRVEASGDRDPQALAAELVDDREHFQWPPIYRASATNRRPTRGVGTVAAARSRSRR
jgi:hypothetical protein